MPTGSGFSTATDTTQTAHCLAQPAVCNQGAVPGAFRTAGATPSTTSGRPFMKSSSLSDYSRPGPTSLYSTNMAPSTPSISTARILLPICWAWDVREQRVPGNFLLRPNSYRRYSGERRETFAKRVLSEYALLPDSSRPNGSTAPVWATRYWLPTSTLSCRYPELQPQPRITISMPVITAPPPTGLCGRLLSSPTARRW